MPEGRKKRREGGHHPPLAQRLVALLGQAVVLATIGYLGYAALFIAGSPPDLRLSVERIEESGSGYLILFTAENSGRQTAADVQIDARLLRDGRSVEQAMATLDYVPGHSQTKGGLVFTQDPRQGDLRLTVSGYQLP